MLYKFLKLFCTHFHAQHFFTYHVINLWNSLPDYVVCCSTLNSFKLKLHNFNVCSYCEGRAFMIFLGVPPSISSKV